MRDTADPADILEHEVSRFLVRYEVNHFGHRCITVWRRNSNGVEVKVDGASIGFVDSVARWGRRDLPPGLREMIAIRRNHAVDAEPA